MMGTSPLAAGYGPLHLAFPEKCGSRSLLPAVPSTNKTLENMKKALLLSLAVMALGRASAQCPVGQSEITVAVSTDAYGSETTWEITGPGGSPVYGSGGPYANQTSAGAFPQTPVTFCAPVGTTLEFTIEDSYGDGMCCAYGEGGYTVTMNGCNVALSGGEFADDETGSFTVVAQPTTDLGVISIEIDPVFVAGSQTITGQLKNYGSTAITSFTLSYSVNGGAPVSQTITAPIAACATYTYTHGTPWNASTPGAYDLMVTVSGVNGGGAHDDATNDSETASVSVATQVVQRTVLIEEFTSSTCPPCASFNEDFDPLLNSLNTNVAGSNVAAVKYQMNWPAPGNDPSYNPDGNARKTYYGVSGIPDGWIDGIDMGDVTTQITEAGTIPAFVDIDLSYSLAGMNMTVTAEVSSYANFSGNYKLHIAATEDFYAYAASTTSQDEYHYAQRKMLPNAQGTTLTNMTAGGTQTVTASHTFVEGSPAQGNYNLWGILNNTTLVAFVQNNTTKEILQAQVLNVGIVGMNEENALANSLIVFPNPSNGLVNVAYTTAASTQATFQVRNVLGEVVMSVNQSIGAGAQRQTLDMGALSNGMYELTITADGLRASRKVSLNK